MSTVNAVAGLDIPYGKRKRIESLQLLLEHIFKEILPEHGYMLREKQMELAEEILDACGKQKILLAEAEVGTGKTHAYLIAAALVKRGRVNDFWNSKFYPKMNYVELTHLPVVISTSSIALQKAIVRDYIPELSQILIKHGIINTPLTSVIRKGKEHYICEAHLCEAIKNEKDHRIKQRLGKLLSSGAIDLADEDELSPYIKRKICVPSRCDEHCRLYTRCRYLQLMNYMTSPKIDFQVCNHNYLMADILRRSEGLRPLIPNYQAVVIDEAHKFLQAVRQMMGVELPSTRIPEMMQKLKLLHFKENKHQELILKMAKILVGQNHRLFCDLRSGIPTTEGDNDEQNRFSVVITKDTVRYISNMREITLELAEMLSDADVQTKDNGRKSQIVWQLRQVHRQIAAISKHNQLIFWLEKVADVTVAQSAGELLLCAIPNNLNQRLYEMLWRKGLPIILTSGTLSAGGDFSHTKRILGIKQMQRIDECSKASPFNHQEQVLLYISEKTPFPDLKSKDYIDAVAWETEKLILASHGHAAVLFTSYRVMDIVWQQLNNRLQFPLFRMDKGGVNALEKFRSSGNGVLFASGALWEGIDLPGDILSMLIIVKLPFAVPDPISEYEQTLYPSLADYKREVVVPEMLIKLKQGFGRLIRTESDTGVVALLDSRVSQTGAYRHQVLQVLPDCRVTPDISELQHFIKDNKSRNYFK